MKEQQILPHICIDKSDTKPNNKSDQEMSMLVYLNAVICFAEHFVKLVEREVFREQLVSQSVHFDQTLQFHDACG